MSRITKLTGLFLLMSSCVICDITAEVDRCGLGQEDLRKRSGLCFTKVVLVVLVLSAEGSFNILVAGRRTPRYIIRYPGPGGLF